MAFMTVKLVPGVRAEQTPLLLQAGVIQSNNVRWRDGLPEKIGGWKKFYPSALPGPVRELWTWEDLNGNDHLAAAGESTVTVLTGNAPTNVTPQSATRNPSALATTSGSPLVVVTDVGSGATIHESVTLQTPYSISGICIYPGNYPIVSVTDADHYTINIGQNAGATVAGVACTISSVGGSPSFTVHLANHGLAVGANFSLVLPTTVGGVTLSGFSAVATVIDANNFTITAPNTAASIQTVNYGNVANPGIQLVQWITASQQPAILITAAAAFSAGYWGIAMPHNPGTIFPGMTVTNQTTGQVLGTVASYAPVSVTQQAQPFISGQTTLTLIGYDNSSGIVPGMSITDVTVGSGLGTVASYVGYTLTLSAPATFTAHYTVTATAAWTSDYGGIHVPANPGWVVANMAVTDLTLGGTALGFIQNYRPLNATDQVRNQFFAGNTSITMYHEGWRCAVPGAHAVDLDQSASLGTVVSYLVTNLVVTPPATFHGNPGETIQFTTVDNVMLLYQQPALGPIPVNSAGANDVLGFGLTDTLTFSSGTNHVLTFIAALSSGSAGPNDVLAFTGSAAPTLTASAAFTTTYSAINMPPNPGWITTGMTVFDETIGQVLGVVNSYGPSARTSLVYPNAFSAGATTIQMLAEGWRFALPGMQVFDLTPSRRLIGTVSSYIGLTLTLTAGALVSGAANDTLEFNSGTQAVLFVDSRSGPLPLPFNSGGASDVLAFIGASAPPPAGLTPYSADDWCMFNFGSILLINPEDGPIFQYDPTTGLGGSQLVVPAPSKVHGMFLAMPEQMVVTYGASTQGVQDPMLVAWSDAGSFNTWILAINNQAGTYRLSRGSRIVGGIQAPMQAMLWTDVGLWLMTYIGYPDVWGFSEIAQECGLIAKKAVAAIGVQVFWMGQDKFWTFTGGQVQPLPCEVWDAIFQNLNRDLVDLIRCYTDTAFDSIGWFFPSLATKLPGALQENDSFITFNRVTGEWDYGTPVDIYGDGKVGGIMVSDWTDANVFGNPISAMTNATGTQSQLMWMDMGHDADGQPIDWWIRTGLFMLSEGEDFLFVDRCRPDFRWRTFSSPTTPGATISITLYAQDDSDNPSKPPKVYGPFPVTETTGSFDPRARGRYFSLKVEGNDLGSFARLGAVKFRFAPDGRAG
jgi:hypothetical protein